MRSAGPDRDGPSRVTTHEALRTALAELRSPARRLALVPTMGYLHEGHLSLVDEARRCAEAVALTIFVNPLQFEPEEDLERYPRDPQRDLGLAGERGVDLVFAPDVHEMFPAGPPRISVDPGAMGRRLCGAFRPRHFGGVLTIVARLFGLFRPDVAVFGRKDYQQAVLIRRMALDLSYPVEIRVGPLVREADGLALSSRNAYLSDPERAQAVGLFRALSAIDDAFRAGTRSSEALLASGRRILGEFPVLDVQYLELVDPESLEPVVEAVKGTVAAVAAHCGPSRLIDNVVLGADAPDPRIGAR